MKIKITFRRLSSKENELSRAMNSKRADMKVAGSIPGSIRELLGEERRGDLRGLTRGVDGAHEGAQRSEDFSCTSLSS